MRKVIREVLATDGTRAEISQHGRNLFALTITSRPYPRNRWGTREEIEDDASFFETHGRLPPPEGDRW